MNPKILVPTVVTPEGLTTVEGNPHAFRKHQLREGKMPVLPCCVLCEGWVHPPTHPLASTLIMGRAPESRALVLLCWDCAATNRKRALKRIASKTTGKVWSGVVESEDPAWFRHVLSLFGKASDALR